MIKQAFDENGIKFAVPTVQVAGGEEHATAAAGICCVAGAPRRRRRRWLRQADRECEPLRLS